MILLATNVYFAIPNGNFQRACSYSSQNSMSPFSSSEAWRWPML